MFVLVIKPVLSNLAMDFGPIKKGKALEFSGRRVIGQRPKLTCCGTLGSG
jgi:hypothetical protein